MIRRGGRRDDPDRILTGVWLQWNSLFETRPEFPIPDPLLHYKHFKVG
jgi:hypothetical protein